MIQDIPKALAGGRDRHNLRSTFWGTVAHSLFTDISEAYEEKSKGNSDTLGNSWKDISRETKAYKRPIKKGNLDNRRTAASRNKSTLGILTPGEYKKWKKIFGVTYHKKIREGVDEDTAKEDAAKIAWTVLKGQGAQTKIDILGNRDLLILRNTDRLFRSLLPGKITKHSYRKYNKDQIYTVTNNGLRIGTKVEYVNEVSKDRPIWPSTKNPWFDKAVEKGMESLVSKIQVILR